MAKRNNTPEPRSPKTPPPCTVRQFKVGYIHDRSRDVPWIRLQGEWLNKAGFSTHTKVQIHAMDGFLVLKAMDG